MKTTKNTFENFPDWILEKWQGIADLLAEIIGIPAALIMKTENDYMEVFISSHSENNPYSKGDHEKWYGLYCETVIKTQKKLLVSNALKDKKWNKNPDIELGMIAYLGFPLNFPDNKPFGTLCILDNMERPFTLQNEKLIQQFKNVIELDLAILQSFEFKTSQLAANVVQVITERNDTDEALRVSRFRLNEAYKLAHIGIWEWEANTDTVTWTDELFHISGLDPSLPAPSFKEHPNLYTPGSWKILSNLVERAMETGEPYQAELELIRPNGNIRYVNAFGGAKHNSKGQIEGLFGTLQDITKLKLAEENIKKLNRVYTVLSNINKTILRTRDKQELLDKACRIAVDDGGFMMAWIGMVNSTTNKIDVVASAGKTGEYLKGINIDLNDHLRSSGPTGQAIKKGKSVYSNNIETDDKMIPWRETALNLGFRSSITQPVFVSGKIIGAYTMYSGEIGFFNEGEIKLLDEMASNISFALEFIESEKNREHAEEELEKKSTLLQSIVEGTTDAIFVKDTLGKYLLFNHAAEVFTGKKAGKVLGKDDTTLFPADEATTIMQSDQKVMKEGKIATFEEYATIANGKKTIFLNTKGPILDKNGKVVGLFGVARDITERKQAEMELIKAKEHAEESDQLKSAFLANMSHEIRTPMNGILGFIELLKEPDLTGPEHDKYIQVIEKSGARLLNIINDIISISKVESGQMEVSLSETNINDQIEYLCTFFKPTAEQKGIDLLFNCSITGKDAVLTTDREKLYAILTNLIKNALKFTHQGTIEIGYDLVETDNYLSLHTDNFPSRHYLFYVKDTGTGILPEQKEFIFERFRQGSNSLTHSYEGAGLGLAISKAYVEMLGGKIWVESVYGKGSIFYFTIPCPEL
jgi:PAS domain S-box-containing protein